MCALAFTIHIMVIDHFTVLVDGVRMSCIQFLVAAVLSAVGMLVSESPTWEAIRVCAWPILYVGVFSSGVAYTLQIVAQKDSNPAGAIAFGNQMSGKEYLGCVLMLAAVVLAQLPEKKRAEQ